MKIWVVMECGYEYSVPVSAFFTEELANTERDKIQKESKGMWVSFSVAEIDLCEANCQTAVEAT